MSRVLGRLLAFPEPCSFQLLPSSFVEGDRFAEVRTQICAARTGFTCFASLIQTRPRRSGFTRGTTSTPMAASTGRTPCKARLTSRATLDSSLSRLGRKARSL